MLPRPASRLGLAAGAALVAAGQAVDDPLAARTKGSREAPVVVYEMADFQCPACRTFALETMPVLEREYVRTGKVRWVFVNFPLTDLHPNAVAAAEVAMCAARQGRFWPMHDALFNRQPQWAGLADPAPFLLALADTVGIDRAALEPCLDGAATRSAIEVEYQRSRRAGARATPSFYMEGGLLQGAWPVTDFRRILDSIHRVKTAGLRR